MSIRSVDLQVLLPKVPEIQKVKHIENETLKNNQQINIIQDSLKKKEDLKRINKNDKAYKLAINKDERNKNGKNKNESHRQKDKDKKDMNENEGKYFKGSKIDIRI